MVKKILSQVERYSEIEQEVINARKYGVDHSEQKGVWTQAVKQLHPSKMELKVADIVKASESADSLRLVRVNGCLPPFQAGQYIHLAADINGVRIGRPYSISSAPNQTAYYEITIKRKANAFVSDYLLNQIKIGDILESSGPSGHFYYNPIYHGKNLVFIAGGSGITPFMSMVREVTEKGLDRNIHLIYGCSTPNDVPFLDELQSRSERFSNFKFSLVISDPAEGWNGLSGFIDAELLKKLGIDTDHCMFYICGPTQMYNFCIPELKKLNVPQKRIRQEVVAQPENISQDPAWPSGVSPTTIFTMQLNDGSSIPARAGESLLVSLERAGIFQKNLCRAGECSLCRVKLTEGKVFQPSTTLVRESDRKFGYIHSCASYPLSDLAIIR